MVAVITGLNRILISFTAGGFSYSSLQHGRPMVSMETKQIFNKEVQIRPGVLFQASSLPVQQRCVETSFATSDVFAGCTEDMSAFGQML